MKKLIVLFICISSMAFSEVIVRQKSTGDIIYRQNPSFKKGDGLKSAISFSGIALVDLEEVNLSVAVINAKLASKAKEKGRLEVNAFRVDIKELIQALVDLGVVRGPQLIARIKLNKGL
jgi:hypothetical protein